MTFDAKRFLRAYALAMLLVGVPMMIVLVLLAAVWGVTIGPEIEWDPCW